MYFSKKKNFEITDYLKLYQPANPSCTPTFLSVVLDAEKLQVVLITNARI